MEQTHIGVIDSGMGGLSMYAAIKAQDPMLPLIYLADSAYVPYGTKSEAFITQRSEKLVRFLIERNVTTIVIACNTITVTSLDTLRSLFPEVIFIGTVPVIKTAAEKSLSRMIGVLATIRTAESKYLDTLIAQFAKDCTVASLGTDELVPLVEEGETEGERVHSILERVLAPFMISPYDTLVLGCTHFPFLKPAMQHVLGEHVAILDSSEAVARQLHRILENVEVKKDMSDQFLTTGDEDTFRRVLSNLLKMPVKEAVVKKVDIV